MANWFGIPRYASLKLVQLDCGHTRLWYWDTTPMGSLECPECSMWLEAVSELAPGERLISVRLVRRVIGIPDLGLS